MKKLLVFSVSILCLSLSLAVVLHLGDFAVASSAVPVASEVAIADGIEIFTSFGARTIPLPTYSDGTPANAYECVALVARKEDGVATSAYSTNYYLSGNALTLVAGVGGWQGAIGYIIVCQRSAGGAVATEQSTWGEIKSLYQDEE